jgi:hypothetical protein
VLIDDSPIHKWQFLEKRHLSRNREIDEKSVDTVLILWGL